MDKVRLVFAPKVDSPYMISWDRVANTSTKPQNRATFGPLPPAKLIAIHVS